MKNLIKKGPKFLRFKKKSFECGDYTIDVNGVKHDLTLTYCGPECERSNFEPLYDTSCMHFHRELIPEEGNIPGHRVYPGQSYMDDKYVPGVNLSLSVPAERFQTGEVKIYKDGTRILPEYVLTEDDDNWIIDESKIHLGSIWSLTIDDDPRFQNTTIMILRVYGSCIEFGYQTKVIYTPDYSHIEAAEGRIDFHPNIGMDNFKIEDYLDKIHLTLIKDNTNGGADMDRQNEDDIIYPRSYSVGGYREQYPPIPFRERPKRKPVDDDYYDEEDE